MRYFYLSVLQNLQVLQDLHDVLFTRFTSFTAHPRIDYRAFFITYLIWRSCPSSSAGTSSSGTCHSLLRLGPECCIKILRSKILIKLIHLTDLIQGNLSSTRGDTGNGGGVGSKWGRSGGVDPTFPPQ